MNKRMMLKLVCYMVSSLCIYRTAKAGVAVEGMGLAVAWAIIGYLVVSRDHNQPHN